MSHEYVYKISSQYIQKWLRYDIKHVKKHTFFPHFDYRDFPDFIFSLILMFQKVFKGHFSRSVRKSDLYTCIAAPNPDFFY